MLKFMSNKTIKIKKVGSFQNKSLQNSFYINSINSELQFHGRHEILDKLAYQIF